MARAGKRLAGTCQSRQPMQNLDKPLQGDLEKSSFSNGQLRPGKVPHLLSRACFGFAVNNVAISLLQAIVHSIQYPIYNNYLQREGYQTIAIKSLIEFPFCFKIVFAIVSDCFPIYGYRRKPYMNIGWVICAVCMVIATFSPLPPPYLHPSAYDTVTGTHVILMVLALMGVALASVADDGLMVLYASREPLEVRGTLQSTVTFLRYFPGMFMTLFVGTVLNSDEYGGTFDWSLDYNIVMGIGAVISILTLPFTMYFLEDEKHAYEPFGKRCREIWGLLQTRAIYQLIIFFYINGLFNSFDVSPSKTVQLHWAKVEPFTYTLFKSIGCGIFSFSLIVVKKYCLHVSWRKLLFITSVGMVLIDMVPTILIVYDYCRNQYLWMGIPALEKLGEGATYLVASLVVVEVAKEGYESTTYALLTTVRNITIPVAVALTRYSNSFFKISVEQVKSDTMEVRHHVMLCYVLMYVMHLLGNAWLFMLPDQKAAAKLLKDCPRTSFAAGLSVVLLLVLSILFSTTTIAFTLIRSTSCLRLAGGPGC